MQVFFVSMLMYCFMVCCNICVCRCVVICVWVVLKLSGLLFLCFSSFIICRLQWFFSGCFSSLGVWCSRCFLNLGMVCFGLIQLRLLFVFFDGQVEKCWVRLMKCLGCLCNLLSSFVVCLCVVLWFFRLFGVQVSSIWCNCRCQGLSRCFGLVVYQVWQVFLLVFGICIFFFSNWWMCVFFGVLLFLQWVSMFSVLVCCRSNWWMISVWQVVFSVSVQLFVGWYCSLWVSRFLLMVMLLIFSCGSLIFLMCFLQWE